MKNGLYFQLDERWGSGQPLLRIGGPQFLDCLEIAKEKGGDFSPPS